MEVKWYESKEWDKSVAEDFLNRMSKVKDPHRRGEYLKIKAHAVSDVDKRASIMLYEMMEKEVIPSGIHYVAALEGQAKNYFDLKEYTKAEELYRKLQYLPEGTYGSNFKNGVSNSDVMLVKIILLTKQKDKYEEMYKLIKDHDPELDFFRADKFEFLYLAAKLCREMGKMDEAKQYAREALEVTIDKRIDAPRHKDIPFFEAEREQLEGLRKILIN